jgi:hypothetical protein
MTEFSNQTGLAGMIPVKSVATDHSSGCRPFSWSIGDRCKQEGHDRMTSDVFSDDRPDEQQPKAY